MAYVSPNFKTKTALKVALKEGKQIDVFSPGLGNIPPTGRISLEGPHYPAPHSWYAEGTMENGKLVRVS